ncbi:putative cytochrome P450 [Lophium mytilinum]|uniref:Putative cytochrome P450 n=1 Tax=Lophium mytilinum TaxID=390894 RepID=A0A6A6QNX2_9PEZI|nr:putative cytochrome P450 [Lophium mytilinum]
MAIVDIQSPGNLDFWVVPFTKYSTWLILLLIAIPLLRFGFQGRVLKNPSVPIAAVAPGESIKNARQRFRQEAQKMLLEGYRKYKGKPFYVPSPLGELLMLPPKYVEELKTAAVDEVDFVGTFFRMFEGKYTTMGSRATLHPRVARLQLNQYMETVLQPVNDEVVNAFNDEIPVTENWTEVRIGPKLHWITTRAASRMLGGKALASHGGWLQATLDFATDGFTGSQKIKAYPDILKPIFGPMLSEARRIPRHYEVTRNAVVPILESRREKRDAANDFLQWMADDAKGEEQDFIYMADILLKLSFATTHTSAATPVQLVYDLCDYPEYIPSLRAEMEEVLAQHKVLDKRALGKLQKLDSFMKESSRFNPLLVVTFQRIVHKGWTLSDGFTIPAGTQVGFPSQASAMDPDLYPDPEVFDGYRHEKVRAAVVNDPSAVGRTQWAAANLENMAFGYGRHACPGRFFASHEVKMIMVHLLMTYDFKYVAGQKGRPANVMAEEQMVPNHDTKIQMRRKRT